MQISSPSFGRLAFSTWKTCSQKTGEDKSDTIRHSLTLESSMRHRSCIEAEGGSHAKTCQVVLDEFLTFNPTTLTSSRCQLCQQFFLTSTCRKLRKSTCRQWEKIHTTSCRLQPSCSDQAFKSNQTQKISGVFEKKNSKSPSSFHIKNMGMNFFMSKKRMFHCFFLPNILSVDLHHLGCQHPQVSSGQYGRHWCLPIHSWISRWKQSKPRLKEKWHWILIASGSGIFIVA